MIQANDVGFRQVKTLIVIGSDRVMCQSVLQFPRTFHASRNHRIRKKSAR
jgi:hypothetical protein